MHNYWHQISNQPANWPFLGAGVMGIGSFIVSSALVGVTALTVGPVPLASAASNVAGNTFCSMLTGLIGGKIAECCHGGQSQAAQVQATAMVLVQAEAAAPVEEGTPPYQPQVVQAVTVREGAPVEAVAVEEGTPPAPDQVVNQTTAATANP